MKPLKRRQKGLGSLSGASLRRIQREEQEKALQRLADERKAQGLNNQP
jgi:hypothetical protein